MASNATIDWTVKKVSKLTCTRLIKRLLRKYGYPPEKQEKATLPVLQQAELLCRDWAACGLMTITISKAGSA
ncbi:DUF3387 domain-containing protein [Nostoc sp. FACHB-152]|uniref:type I restriction enzyme endonuclease domain-containing protein n=1 Tax=Nostoc sp. FACHB-152 TaxID=2692837 RepID=UPI001683E0AF|nr:type I restriction enzyme endonuclease domain-containing protein [Nostoc sp. FACHB-152]MBD2450559.1 DUF3387 domain-containing protein [Nostoc sp. FACHB-152]